MSRQPKPQTPPATNADGSAGSGGPAPRHRIVIVDDQSILREALRELLEVDHSLEVVGAETCAQRSLRSIATLKPDVVLIDLLMPSMDGINAIREIKRRSAQTRTVVVTAHKSEEYVRAALRAGADGYVLKEASAAELVMAIDSVLHGKRFISPAISEHIVLRYLGHSAQDEQRPLHKLTVRERQVLKQIAQGRRNREMAQALSISIKTVEKHRSNLMNKLKLHNAAALTSFALDNGLVGTTSAGLAPAQEESEHGAY